MSSESPGASNALELALPSIPPPAGWSEVDLHLHTTASDGLLTPSQTVTLALVRGLKTIAVTDHDSTEGVADALTAAATTPLTVVPGVEINTDTAKGELHVLGYYLDIANTHLQDQLEIRRRARLARGLGMVQKLQALGLDVSWERVQEFAGADGGGAVGRPHVARALVERGYVVTIQEAFERFIGRDGPAYVDYEKLTPAEAVSMIHRAHGLAVLAHPSTIDDLPAVLDGLVGHGLAGLECYYGSYPPDTVQGLVALARSRALIATGGSDYHGSEQTVYNATLGGSAVPASVAIELSERRARHAR